MQLIRGQDRARPGQRPSRQAPGKARPAARQAQAAAAKPERQAPAQARRESVHDPLENSIPFLLRRTSRYFRLGLQNRLRRHGLGFSHWFYLRALWLEDGITQRELCKRIEAVEPAAVTALAGLERGGYIRRVRDKANRRQIHIFITPKGRRLRDELLPYAFELSAIGVRGIPESELEVVRSVLNRIRANMSSALLGEGDKDDEGGERD